MDRHSIKTKSWESCSTKEAEELWNEFYELCEEGVGTYLASVPLCNVVKGHYTMPYPSQLIGMHETAIHYTFELESGQFAFESQQSEPKAVNG